MKCIIATIQGADIIHQIDYSGYETVTFTADMDIDCDGSGGNPFHDPYFQPDTRLHFNGKALCAETEPYMVVPPVIIKATKGIVMGSMCEVTYKGRTVVAVVGDSGPTKKVGEGSPALASLLGLDPNPNHGGTDKFEVTYKIHVGVPAVIGCRHYKLQPSSAR